MNNALFLVLVFLLVAGAALLLQAGGPTGMLVSEGGTGQTAYTAAVEVEEAAKQRVHAFTLYSDGRRTLLKGSFQINGQSYPGTILYDGEKSYLIRSGPDQAVVYAEPARLIYGFLPPYAAAGDPRARVLEKSPSSGVPLKYAITEAATGTESVVTIRGIAGLAGIAESDFSVPEGTELIEADRMLRVG